MHLFLKVDDEFGGFFVLFLLDIVFELLATLALLLLVIPSGAWLISLLSRLVPLAHNLHVIVSVVDHRLS